MNGPPGGRGSGDADALAKADPALRRELEGEGDDAHGGERGEERGLRVVVLLRGAAPEGPGSRGGGARGGARGEGEGAEEEGEPAAPRPADYPDRAAWRHALLERRQRRLAADLDPARRALEALGLEVRGGTTSGVVVCDGPARCIRRALHLHHVRSATLDREVRLHRPADDDCGE